MPYTIRKLPGKNKWRVYGSRGEIKAEATSKKKAEAQVRLLYGVEKGWQPTGKKSKYR